jgi:hypothetical protein
MVIYRRKNSKKEKMIYLDINQSQNVVVTLSEKAIGASPSYIWNINDADTNINYVFAADDISPTPWTYNMFSFSVIPGATYGATSGIISAPQGPYIYTCYETNYPYILSVASASKIVEVGILIIEGTASITNTYNNIPTFITYKKI